MNNTEQSARSAVLILCLVTLLTGCSVISAAGTVVSTTVGVGAAVVSTTATVGAAAVGTTVNVGSAVVGTTVDVARAGVRAATSDTVPAK